MNRFLPEYQSFLVVAAVAFALMGPTARCQVKQPDEPAHSSAGSVVSQPEIIRLDPAVDQLIAPGTRVEKLADGFKFTEGPMWYEGRLWISDVVGDKTYAISPNGSVQLLLSKSGGYPDPPPGAYLGPNAMVTDRDGTVLLAQQGGRKIVRIVRSGDHYREKPFLTTYEDKRFNSPNDLVFAPDGSLWFTDPPYGLRLGNKDPSKELPFNAVYRYAKGRLTPVIRDLSLPNGIGFSPDGKTLYVSNSGPNMCVMRYDVHPDGLVSNGTQLIDYRDSADPGVPDGLKVDSAGNLWSTGPGGIRILTPSGKVLGQIKLPQTASNLAFGGDGRTLYVTAQTTVYRIQLLIPGEIPLYRH